MKTDIGNNVRDTSSTALVVFGGYINEAYEEFLKKANHSVLNEDYSITCVANQKDYVLPEDFFKELYVLDTTNGLYLERTDLQKYAQEEPSLVSTSGNINRYTIVTRPVRTQPTAATAITVVSSSNLDNGQTVFIRGYLNGLEVTETVTLTGLAPVTTTNTFDRISKVAKSATTTGNVLLTYGTTTVTILSPRMLDSRVKILRLFQTPDSAYSLTVPYILEFIAMTNDNDAPVVECADYLVARATAKAWKYKRQFNKAQVYDLEAERHWDNFDWSNENDPNMQHQFGVMAYSRETA